jgi:hypothetical protein
VRFLGGQVLRQRGVREAAHAAEEVELPLRHRQADLVHVTRERLVDTRRGTREAAALEAGIRIHGRQQVGALDLVLRARLFDAERGGTQVAVVLQRRLDQPCRRGSVKNSRQPISVARRVSPLFTSAEA